MLAGANVPGPTSMTSPGLATFTALWTSGYCVLGMTGQAWQTLIVAALADAADPSTAVARMAKTPSNLGRGKRMASPPLGEPARRHPRVVWNWPGCESRAASI